jgi:CTP:molybdopterin cytidylyltransferase MocA
MTVAAVVLAAGAATRYGAPKQRELLPAVLTTLEQSDVSPVVVVQGAYPLEAAGARVVGCPNWADGPGASLRCGLAALPDDVTHALVVLADGPNLDLRAVQRVLDNRAAGAIVAASYDGSRSHPVLLARAVWGDVPDEGARALEPLLVDCSDLEPPGDVDYR